MKLKGILVVALAGLFAVSGCKKDKKDDGAAASGAAGSGAAGSAGAMVGSAAGAELREKAGEMAAKAGEMADKAGDMADKAGDMAGKAADTAGQAADMAGKAADTAAAATMTDAEIETMINDVIGMMGAIGKAVTGKDCKAAAAGLTGVLDGNKALLDKMAVIGDDKGISERAKKISEDKKLDDKIAQSMGWMADLGTKCGDDAEVKAATERLFASMK